MCGYIYKTTILNQTSDLYNQGSSLEQISKEEGLCARRIREIIKKYKN